MIISARTKTGLRLFHKYIGFIFSIFIFQLTVTGILLLYPKFFGLNSTFISNSFILKKYEMLTYKDVRRLGNKNDEILLLDGSIYFNKVLIDNFQDKVVNAVYQTNNKYLAIFLEKQINFYNLNIQNNIINIREIKETILNKKIRKVGKSNKGIIYINLDDRNYKLSNQELLATSENSDILWLQKNKVQKDLAKLYLEMHQGKGVPLHRIITELHNGKIMGSFLSYILLISSFSLLFLIISSFFFGISSKRINND